MEKNNNWCNNVSQQQKMCKRVELLCSFVGNLWSKLQGLMTTVHLISQPVHARSHVQAALRHFGLGGSRGLEVHVFKLGAVPVT